MTFINKVKKIFRFLQDDYDCKVSTQEDVFRTAVTYQNSTTAITIRLENREKQISVLLTRLIDGKIPPYPIFIEPDTKLNTFDFDDFLKVRAPSCKIEQSRSASNNDFDKILTIYANNLKTFGRDVLTGDFSVFLELEPIVKDRAKSNI